MFMLIVHATIFTKNCIFSSLTTSRKLRAFDLMFVGSSDVKTATILNEIFYTAGR